MNCKPLAALALCLLMTVNLKAEQKPLQVFILVGQSNMQGHAHVRTLEHLSMDPATASLRADILNADGTPRPCEQTWISYLTNSGVKSGRLSTGFGADENKVGPELAFGISLQKSLGQPILLIKAAWGGKSLHTDFRPPSAGPYVFHPDQLANYERQGKDIDAIRREKRAATGVYYRQAIDHVHDVLGDIQAVCPEYKPSSGYELAGFVWFQGWNDMVDRSTYPARDQPGGYDQYSEVLTHLIRDIRDELSAPELPFVIGVLGVGGPVKHYGPQQQRYATVHQNFRDAMAAPAKRPEFQGSVVSVLTENSWDPELSGLRSRESALKQTIKKQRSEGKITVDNQAVEIESLTAAALTARERKLLEVGISNAEYHYLGSAKIMAGIGGAFADAILQLREKQGTP